MMALGPILFKQLVKVARDNSKLKNILVTLSLGVPTALTLAAVSNSAIQKIKLKKRLEELNRLQKMLYTNNTEAVPLQDAEKKAQLIEDILEKRAQLEVVEGSELLAYKRQLESKSIEELEKLAEDLQRRLKMKQLDVGEATGMETSGELDPLTSLLLQYSQAL